METDFVKYGGAGPERKGAPHLKLEKHNEGCGCSSVRRCGGG